MSELSKKVGCIIQVAVSGPFLEALDYLAMPNQAIVGARVRVPFRSKSIVAVIVGVRKDSNQEPSKLREVEALLDEHPLFSETDLALFRWLASYYHEPLGEVLLSAMPKRLKQGEPEVLLGEPVWRLADNVDIQLPKNAKLQQRILECFVMAQKASNNYLSRSQLRALSSGWKKIVDDWLTRGWLQQQDGKCWQLANFPKLHKHPLNAHQQRAVVQVQQIIQLSRFQPFLLHGITGSGKTEVYLAMIEAVIEQGKQALVLVPEIGLTPQMVERFQAYLQVPVATMHSGMNDKERHCAWYSMKNGDVSVLLGTRSAVFAPFKNLGLCIVDEEHDLSYKQQEGFRYSARDFLVRRAAMENVPIVLGSATPALETLQNVESGRFQKMELPLRAGAGALPKIRVLDIRGEKLQEGVAAPLKAAMKQHLDAGNQVLLFLNRRGFAPVLMCHDCGWQAKCPSCDANMTYHQVGNGGYLQCHHCDTQVAEVQQCPQCASKEMVKVGQGTERLEETMQMWFPQKKVLRIDRDSTRLKGSMAEMTDLAKRGEVDILLGTQMLAKGHDFPKVTLVGMLEVDQGLFSCDFRATERLSQLITQVAGRSGRGQRGGEVIIQSRHPQNPILVQLVQKGFLSVAKSLLVERKSAKLPPFRFQILIRAEAHEEDLVRAFLLSVKGGLELAWQELQLADTEQLDFDLWGPIAAPMLRRQGRYRYQLMMNSGSRKQLHQLLSAIEPAIYKSKLTRKVRWSIDVDPQEMM